MCTSLQYTVNSHDRNATDAIIATFVSKCNMFQGAKKAPAGSRGRAEKNQSKTLRIKTEIMKQ
ncbi:hypothetical protein JCM18694_07240 [Prolixibacter denitrificans]|uniref:Uncharacterized protein n=1 Tax=Prolixibacter denitrificans TaxID=1541063 RepID=A0ABQ0ZGJ1_9BACT|nr:hypothetical protein JCM18694_07240 [Prolixibacter denitrificans]